MTDLEITRLCAEAMGIHGAFSDWDDNRWEPPKRKHNFLIAGRLGNVDGVYDPLHDDAQSMALVKRFMLNICAFSGMAELGYQTRDRFTTFSDESINRAICECVAKMQAAK